MRRGAVEARANTDAFAFDIVVVLEGVFAQASCLDGLRASPWVWVAVLEAAPQKKRLLRCTQAIRCAQALWCTRAVWCTQALWCTPLLLCTQALWCAQVL